MNEKLDLYRIFHIVSKHHSFTKAGEELYMTQSAVSQAISRLEKSLEIQLFHRTSKGVVLTNEGKLLNDHVGSALRLIKVAENKLMEFKTLQTGTLRIGVGDTISRYFLLPYLEKFHTIYPGIKLNILNGTTPEICQFVKTGKVDIGVCNLPVEDDQLHVIPCKQIQDIFVCGEKYKRLTEKPVPLQYLMRMPLIFLERKSNSRRYVENILSKKGCSISPAFELGSHDLVLQFAKINLGISCVVREFVLEDLQKGEIYEIKLEEEIPKRSIGIVYLKDMQISYAAKKFVESINRYLL